MGCRGTVVGRHAGEQRCRAGCEGARGNDGHWRRTAGPPAPRTPPAGQLAHVQPGSALAVRVAPVGTVLIGDAQQPDPPAGVQALVEGGLSTSVGVLEQVLVGLVEDLQAHQPLSQSRPSMPVQPGAPTNPRKAEAQRLWSVMAATSSPAARMQAKARPGSPAPSDSQVWLCRSAWTSHRPGNSLERRLVPQASCPLGALGWPQHAGTIARASSLWPDKPCLSRGPRLARACARPRAGCLASWCSAVALAVVVAVVSSGLLVACGWMPLLVSREGV